MKIAAYQAPLLPSGSRDALGLIRGQIGRCEREAVALLCCPEAVIGGLADQADDPRRVAIASSGIEAALASLASETVTVVVGFTELADDGRLFNAAAVCLAGSVSGVYRKRHPAINRSVYHPGRDMPVFEAGGVTFGIVICNDSNFPEPARLVAAAGAAVLVIPANNALPVNRGGRELVTEARRVDVATAMKHGLWVVRADVSGTDAGLRSYGSSGVVSPDGTVVAEAKALAEDLLIVDIEAPAS